MGRRPTTNPKIQELCLRGFQNGQPARVVRSVIEEETGVALSERTVARRLNQIDPVNMFAKVLATALVASLRKELSSLERVFREIKSNSLDWRGAGMSGPSTKRKRKARSVLVTMEATSERPAKNGNEESDAHN